MASASTKHKVAIVMGSKSDYATMKNCEKILKLLKVKFETKIVSAHRTPERMFKFAKAAEDNNFSVIIAGAGGSAHLPGMIASLTTIPVIGVPVESGAMNAGLYAASIIALTNKEIKKNLKNYRSKQSKAVKQKP